MEVLTIIGGCCLLFVIIHSYRTYQHDKEICDEIKKLAEQISKLETEDKGSDQMERERVKKEGVSKWANTAISSKPKS